MTDVWLRIVLLMFPPVVVAGGGVALLYARGLPLWLRVAAVFGGLLFVVVATTNLVASDWRVQHSVIDSVRLIPLFLAEAGGGIYLLVTPRPARHARHAGAALVAIVGLRIGWFVTIQLAEWHSFGGAPGLMWQWYYAHLPMSVLCGWADAVALALVVRAGLGPRRSEP